MNNINFSFKPSKQFRDEQFVQVDMERVNRQKDWTPDSDPLYFLGRGGAVTAPCDQVHLIALAGELAG